MTPEARMRVVFDDLARDDMDALMVNWAPDGIYFNPVLGPPARSHDAVKNTIATLSTGLKSRGEVLSIDRVTQVLDASPPRAYVEWHVEAGSSSARQGKMGLHVVSFNADGLLHRVTVFAHA